MKRRNLIFVMLLVFSGLFVIQSCKKENPVAFTEEASFTIPALVAPATGGFLNVTGTTVDLKWASTNAKGDPENWKVYFGTGDDPSLIQTGYTQETITVNVLPGYKYNWKVVGTDTHGISSRSPIWSFEVVDTTVTLDMKMTWTTDANALFNLNIAPETAVNLRLLILKPDLKTNAVPIIGTAGFKEYSGFNKLADGTYYIVTDVLSTVNYNNGTSNVPFDLSINLAFSQRGTLLQLNPSPSYIKTLSFPDVMTNKFNCSSYKTVLAKVTKTGNTYTMDNAVSYIVPPPPAALVGVWHGSDFDYPSTIVTSIVGGNLLIDGVGTGWISDPAGWGEVPQSTIPAEVVVNLCAGTVTIANQKFMTTKYLGVVQPSYYIQGTGTFDLSGAFPVMTLTYDFIQGGTSIASAGFGVKSFTATLTLDPSAKSLLTKEARSNLIIAKPKLK
jgi:hypothetical protein